MNFVFDIGGQLCAADQVRMRGNTLEAEFSVEAADLLAQAFDAAEIISLPNLLVTYSIQNLVTDKERVCTATFSVNSSAGRVLH
jgi:hypothetical protein